MENDGYSTTVHNLTEENKRLRRQLKITIATTTGIIIGSIIYILFLY